MFLNSTYMNDKNFGLLLQRELHQCFSFNILICSRIWFFHTHRQTWLLRWHGLGYLYQPWYACKEIDGEIPIRLGCCGRYSSDRVSYAWNVVHVASKEGVWLCWAHFCNKLSQWDSCLRSASQPQRQNHNQPVDLYMFYLTPWISKRSQHFSNTCRANISLLGNYRLTVYIPKLHFSVLRKNFHCWSYFANCASEMRCKQQTMSR